MRHKSGRYCARVSANNKEFWKSLGTSRSFSHYGVTWIGPTRTTRFSYHSPLLLQVVNLDERDPRGVIFASHDRCVVPRRERLDDRRFRIVCRGKPGRLDEGLL